MNEKVNDDYGKRCPMGVAGLDEIMSGGLPLHRFYLLQGNPGVGKTTLAMQFLLEGARQGEKVLYITLSETKEELVGVARSHGWSLENICLFELSSIEKELLAENQNTVFHPSELELNRTTQVLLDELDRVKPQRVVFDSLSEMRLLTQTSLRYRREILSLKQYFVTKKCTVFVLDDLTGENGDLQCQSIAHGVIFLEKTLTEFGTVRHHLEILKLRGVKFRHGRHDYVINTGGIEVFPRLVASDSRTPFKNELLSSGIAEFDTMLGGGLHCGTSNIFMGPAGSGKSSLAMKFIYETAKRNQKSAIFAFDENIGLALSRMNTLGADLTPYVESGMVSVQQVDPAEISPGEMASRVKELVESQGIKVLLIDSLNGYLNAMPGERYLMLQLHELLAYLGNRGVVTIMTLAQHGLVGQMQTPVDLTYLGDTILLLRYFENAGAIKKALSVVKKRSGMHEDQIRELSTRNGHIEIGQPLSHFQGILTGTPIYRSLEGNGDTNGAIK